MFSQLGPLFRNAFRQAEPNDTRQHIPHEERDKGRKKREEEENKKADHPDPWQDNTSVSVIALQAFLIDFLKNMPDANGASQSVIAKNDVTQEEALPSRPPEPKRPQNTENARAVRAYQSQSNQTNPPSMAAHSPDTIDNDATENMLESQELRDIHGLIADLKILADNHVQDLNIVKSGSFIESLTQAVRVEKSRLNI